MVVSQAIIASIDNASEELGFFAYRYQCIGLLEMGETDALLDLKDSKVKTHMKKKLEV